MPVTPPSGPADAPSAAKVAIASAVGTTVEYYDFTLYGTAAGLVFDKLFFSGLDGPAPSSRRSPRSSSASSHAPRRPDLRSLRRPARPQEDPHPHDVDHGRRHRRDRAAAVVRHDRRLGARAAGHLRVLQGIGVGGEYGGAVLLAVEYAPAERRGSSAARAHRRPRRPAARRRRLLARGPAAGRGLPGLGLARVLPGQPRAAGRRRLHPAAASWRRRLRAGSRRPRRSPSVPLKDLVRRPAAAALLLGDGHPVRRGVHVQPVLGLPAGLRRHEPRAAEVAGPPRHDGRCGARHGPGRGSPVRCRTGSAQAGVQRRRLDWRWSSPSPSPGSSRVREPGSDLRDVRDRARCSTARSTARSRRSGPSCSTPATATRRSARCTRSPASSPPA